MTISTQGNGAEVGAVPSAKLWPNDPQGLNPQKGCEVCEGAYPMYGVAPHECYWRKGPEFVIGQSTLLPIDQWDACFIPDLEDGETWADFVYPSACGVFYCPTCQRDRYRAAWDAFVAKFGPPPAQGTEARTAETERLGPKDDGPVGSADASELPQSEDPVS